MFPAELSTTIGLLAQQAAPAGGEGSFLQLVVPFVLIGGLYYLMFVLPQRSQERRLSDLASSLKENDHVVTNGGIFGVVTGVQRDEGRVTLRIDEATGTKIRVTIHSISSVLNKDKDEQAKS